MSAQNLIAKLQRRDFLTADEEQHLGELLEPPRTVPAGVELVRAGDRPTQSTLLLSGYMGRIVVGPGGERQFTQLNLSGDFLDLHSFLMKQMDHGVVALTDCVVATTPHAKLRRLTETQPHLTRMLWLETVIDAAIHRQWLYGMGRQDAVSRAAHLICELALRSQAAELGGPEGFDMPLTQTVLADVLGVTAVHANRSLMSLRRGGLIEQNGPRLVVLDWHGLAAQGQFDPAYLRLEREPI